MINRKSEIDIEFIKSMSIDKLRDFLLGCLESNVGFRDNRMELSQSAYDDRPVPYTVTIPAQNIGEKNKYKILLTKSAKQYPQQRFFQMSHEVVHLLKYSDSRDNYKKTTCLEEGFATFNSFHECRNLVPGYDSVASPKRKKAMDILCEIGGDSDIFSFVQIIRSNKLELSGKDNQLREFIENKNKYKGIWSKEELCFLFSRFHDK